MKTFRLTSNIWWRAQAIYGALNLLCALFTPLWDAAAGHHQFIGDDFFGLALLSIGFALICGIPAWLGMSAVMMVLAKPAARRGLLGFAILSIGLLATKAALYTGFSIVLGGTAGSSDEPLILLFSALSYAAMALSFFWMRGAIARHADELRGEQPGISTSADDKPAHPSINIFP